jgi:hypothetical protein
MSSDAALIMGIVLLIMIGVCIGWYLCERWYSKSICIILEECKKLNAATIALWEDILKHKEKNQQDQDNTSK